MSGSLVEFVWIPTNSTSLRFGNLPQKSSEITRELRQAVFAHHQLPVSPRCRSRITAQRNYITAATGGLRFDDDDVREPCFQIDDPFNSQFITSFNQSRRVNSSNSHRNDISYLNRPVDKFSYLKPVKQPSYVKPKSVVDSHTANKTGKTTDTQRHDSDEVSFHLRKSISDVVSAEQEPAVEW